ncbi:MAG: aromatic amino acid hydroxylase [Candidatus Delongbacteria bacterium]
MEIPAHLKAWTVEQRPEYYTAIDHAAWRYILRISGRFFAKAAHPAYLDGLQATGISSERIPLIQEMDEKMKRIGWRAVAVSGFIPPQAFMEFQSLGILPIACDMRKLEHVLYTPAPDVVHEAAGHAPIIADPDYSDYLRAYGAISRRAIYSHHDMDLYRAIRRLSVVKEDPAATAAEVEAAQRALDETLAALDWVSEATELSRMYWWTVEYGLVGALENPRIYGAGLLSSAGESWHCLGPQVEKRPLGVDCVHQTYDITKPQPQLYVTPDFLTLRAVLEEYAAGMACRTGGVPALDKALRARTPVTVTLDSGLQVSGVLAERLLDAAGRPAYLRFSGPVLLAEDEQVLRGHGRDTHAHGFGTALGPLAGREGGTARLDGGALRELGFGGGGRGRLAFESGVVLEGRLAEVREGKAGNQLLRFTDCQVSWGDRLLFDPAWGDYDLACGQEVPAVSGGWVDGMIDPEDLPRERPCMKCNLDEGNRALNELYAELRRLRERGEPGPAEQLRLEEIAAELDAAHPEDWLLRLELLELGAGLRPERITALRGQLESLAARGGEWRELVERGLALCN